MDRFVPRDDGLIFDDVLVWGDALVWGDVLIRGAGLIRSDALPVMASAAWPSMCRAGLEADFLVCVLCWRLQLAVKRKLKHAPGGVCPGCAASTLTVAPCCWAISLTMGKPSPEPSTLVPRAR